MINSIRQFFKSHKDSMLSVVALILVVVASVVYFSSGIREASSTIHMREIPIYCVDRTDKKVALSFDAAWGDEETASLLAILAKYNIRATFFMTGGWIEQYPEDVKAIHEAGHDLANHSASHKHMSKLTSAGCTDEILIPHELVRDLVGVDMCLFRPPFGEYNDNLIRSAQNCGYYTIQWSVDSLDWKDYGADKIVSTVLNHKNLCDGAIILLHNGAKYTKDALERIILGLQEEGYEIVPISELIMTDNYVIDSTGKQVAD